MDKKEIIDKIKNEKVGVLGTDTLYGLVALASSRASVEYVYDLKKRDRQKPFIVLISKFDDIFSFGVEIDGGIKSFLKKIWPGKISVILPCDDDKLFYIHRGKKSIAFRVPDKKSLRDIIDETGPIVAPSANLEGSLPAKNIKEAKEYFGSKIDFYNDEGTLSSKPSTLIKVEDNKINVLRRGEVNIKKNV